MSLPAQNCGSYTALDLFYFIFYAGGYLCYLFGQLGRLAACMLAVATGPIRGGTETAGSALRRCREPDN